jgi:hypothetical protein
MPTSGTPCCSTTGSSRWTASTSPGPTSAPAPKTCWCCGNTARPSPRVRLGRTAGRERTGRRRRRDHRLRRDRPGPRRRPSPRVRLGRAGRGFGARRRHPGARGRRRRARQKHRSRRAAHRGPGQQPAGRRRRGGNAGRARHRLGARLRGERAVSSTPSRGRSRAWTTPRRPRGWRRSATWFRLCCPIPPRVARRRSRRPRRCPGVVSAGSVRRRSDRVS